MKKIIVYAVLALLILPLFNNVARSEGNRTQSKKIANNTLISKHGY